MSKCRYCQKDAGLFSDKHPSCASFAKETHAFAVDSIAHLFAQGGDIGAVHQALIAARTNANLSEKEHRQSIVEGVQTAIQAALEDGVISCAEQENLDLIRAQFEIHPEELNKGDVFNRFQMGCVLREVLDGRVPSVTPLTPLPVLLAKSEGLIWVFDKVKFYRRKTRRTYKAGHQGLSIRVMKGVYWKLGATSGQYVDAPVTELADEGLFIITNRASYHVGAHRTLKVLHSDLLHAEGYEDAVELQEDGRTADQLVFKGLNGWFAHNLVANLKEIDAQ